MKEVLADLGVEEKEGGAIPSLCEGGTGRSRGLGEKWRCNFPPSMKEVLADLGVKEKEGVAIALPL